jgi:hypothetical protein
MLSLLHAARCPLPYESEHGWVLTLTDAAVWYNVYRCGRRQMGDLQCFGAAIVYQGL